MPARDYERRVLETEFEVRSTPNGHKIIEGYAAKYNRYSENLGGFVEVVRPGFFDRVLNDPEILARYNHSTVLGRTGAGTLRVSSDEVGLSYEIDVNTRDPEAVSVLAKVERGDVHRSSFAFTVTRDGDEWTETEQGFPLRALVSAARLHDVAPVDEPAYRDTESGARALRSFAAAQQIDPQLVEVAAERGELIDLIRGARALGDPQPMWAEQGTKPADAERQTPEPAEQVTAAAPVVLVKLELERLRALRRARVRPR